jgi:hypothetical protein
MKALIVILMILAAVFVFRKLTDTWRETVETPKRSQRASDQPAAPTGDAALPGLPSYLESSLAAAKNGGGEALRNWLKTWRSHIQDPRLAAIELDCVVLLNLKDHKAARELFRQVQARVQPDSPVYERVRKLSPAYAD